MQRVTISVPDEFAADLDAFTKDHFYAGRSEALRDLARIGLTRSARDAGAMGRCVATLSYVFNHQTRQLTKRLASTHHKQSQLHVATLHFHLDGDDCLEVVILRGEVAAVRDLANRVIAERGVVHGEINFSPIPASGGDAPHSGHAPRNGKSRPRAKRSAPAAV